MLERPLFVPKNFVCLLKERVETFYNEQKVSIKITIWQMVDEMAKQQIRAKFSSISLLLDSTLFGENVISSVKERSHSNMLESKVWCKKREIKNLKVKFTKTCDQYPRKFNVSYFYGSIIFLFLQKILFGWNW